jgi:hypothetical protein
MNARQAGTPFPYQLPALRNKETRISDATRGYFGSTRLIPRPNSQETHAVGRSYLERSALPHIVWGTQACRNVQTHLTYTVREGAMSSKQYIGAISVCILWTSLIGNNFSRYLMKVEAYRESRLHTSVRLRSIVLCVRYYWIRFVQDFLLEKMTDNIYVVLISQITSTSDKTKTECWRFIVR